MPRNGSGVYSKPAGTTAVPNTTIESAKFNAVVDDLVQDANDPRPETAGGTGSGTKEGARANLELDKKVVYAAKAADYTALAADNNATLRFTTAATLSLTPAATLGVNWHCTVIADGGDVIVDPNGSETINGAVTFVVADGNSATIICDGSAFFAAATISPRNAGQLSGFRNLIINPLLGINQRAKSGTVILTAGNYGHDRFKAGASGCTYTFSTSNGVTTFNISAGSLQHIVEASNFAGRQGDYVLSWAGTAQGRIGAGSYGASGIPKAACDGSVNVTLEWNTGTLSLPQFEREFVTDFSGRHVQQELALCQRYAELVTQQLPGGAFAAANLVFGGTFKVPKRDTPSMAALNHGIYLGNGTPAENVLNTTFTADAQGYHTDHTSFTGSVTTGLVYFLRNHVHLAEAEL